jgi:hypothetical protein
MTRKILCAVGATVVFPCALILLWCLGQTSLWLFGIEERYTVNIIAYGYLTLAGIAVGGILLVILAKAWIDLYHSCHHYWESRR